MKMAGESGKAIFQIVDSDGEQIGTANSGSEAVKMISHFEENWPERAPFEVEYA